MKLKPTLGLSFDKIKGFHIRDVFECQNIIYYVAYFTGVPISM